MILIFSNGSNLQAIIDDCQKQNIVINISAVFSDNSTAYDLAGAKQSIIPSVIMQKSDYIDNHAYDAISHNQDSTRINQI
ncbi:MAG: formyltransferase family protein [Arsenophonus sp. NC-PG7-MAG3]